MSTTLNDYEFLATLTGQMRSAADRGEWNSLISLEQQLNLRVAGMALADEPPDETSRLRIVQLLRKILADDAEIRSNTQNWMRQLKDIMQSNQQEQRLNRAYYGAK
jgi:flagellar protein FliT